MGRNENALMITFFMSIETQVLVSIQQEKK
jgi:hypothetical protein